jgi:hypothetical protein
MTRVAALRAAAPDTIYEEDEEECEAPDTRITPQSIPLAGTSATIGIVSFGRGSEVGSVLKEKSNITRSPKKLIDPRIESQNNIVEGRGTQTVRRPLDGFINITQPESSAVTAVPSGITSKPPLRNGSSIIDDFALGTTRSRVRPFTLTIANPRQL